MAHQQADKVTSHTATFPIPAPELRRSLEKGPPSHGKLESWTPHFVTMRMDMMAAKMPLPAMARIFSILKRPGEIKKNCQRNARDKGDPNQENSHTKSKGTLAKLSKFDKLRKLKSNRRFKHTINRQLSHDEGTVTISEYTCSGEVYCHQN